MRKRGCAFLCSAVLLTGVFLRMPGEMWQVQAETIDTAAFAEETARLTNQFRQENGLAPLKMAPVLLELSARRAEELKDAYGHTRRTGGTGLPSLRSPRWMPTAMRRKMWQPAMIRRRA